MEEIMTLTTLNELKEYATNNKDFALAISLMISKYFVSISNESYVIYLMLNKQLDTDLMKKFASEGMSEQEIVKLIKQLYIHFASYDEQILMEYSLILKIILEDVLQEE
jgi:hypothetical protein